MKIHISSETQKALQEFDTFILEERGKVEMKVAFIFNRVAALLTRTKCQELICP